MPLPCPFLLMFGVDLLVARLFSQSLRLSHKEDGVSCLRKKEEDYEPKEPKDNQVEPKEPSEIPALAFCGFVRILDS